MPCCHRSTKLKQSLQLNDNRISKHVRLRKEQTAAASARGQAFCDLRTQRMPALERVDPATGAAKRACGWGSESGIRQIVENAGARLWDMPKDNDCAFHMYAR